MKFKSLAIFLSVGVVFLVLMNPATAKTPQGPCTGLRDTPRALIRCAFRTVGIPGEIPTALYVAERESGFNERAFNGICAGLFQMHLAYWQGRVNQYLYRSQFPNAWPQVSAFNGRANALVAAKMVRQSGWSPWSTAP